VAGLAKAPLTNPRTPLCFHVCSVGDTLVALNLVQPFAEAVLVAMFLRFLGLIMVATSTIFEPSPLPLPLPLPVAPRAGAATSAPAARQSAGGTAKQRSKRR
jgi:hypothetical protein